MVSLKFWSNSSLGTNNLYLRMIDSIIVVNAGYKISGDIQILPSTVRVYANNAVLDTLSSIHTVFTTIAKGDKNITRRIRLQRINGATIKPSIVTVIIPIEEYTDLVGSFARIKATTNINGYGYATLFFAPESLTNFRIETVQINGYQINWVR